MKSIFRNCARRYSLVLHCASLLGTIFASLARAHERVHVRNVRDFPQTKLDSEINSPFLLNEHGDPEIFPRYLLRGAVTSWLVRSSPDRVVRVPLTTQVYKWVPANLMLGDSPAMDWHPIQGGVEILLVASCL